MIKLIIYYKNATKEEIKFNSLDLLFFYLEEKQRKILNKNNFVEMEYDIIINRCD